MNRFWLGWAFCSVLLSLVSVVVDVRYRFGFGVLWTWVSGVTSGSLLACIVLRRTYIFFHRSAEDWRGIASSAIQNTKESQAQVDQILAMLAQGKEPGAAGLDHFVRFAALAHIAKGAKMTEQELEQLSLLFVRRLATAGLVEPRKTLEVN
jgi:hypothetical protein